MAEGKNSFVLYTDNKDVFDCLTDEQAGKLIKHIFAFVNDENPQFEDNLLNIASIPIIKALKRDLKKWDKIREKRSQAGKASAEKRKQNQQVLTSVESVEQTSTNPTVSVNVNDNVTVSVNDSVNNNNVILKEDNKETPNSSINTIPISNRQEEMKQHLLSLKSWCHQAGMKAGLKSPEECESYLLEFINEQILDNSEDKENYGLLRKLPEIQTHFRRWAAKMNKGANEENSKVGSIMNEILNRK